MMTCAGFALKEESRASLRPSNKENSNLVPKAGYPGRLFARNCLERFEKAPNRTCCDACQRELHNLKRRTKTSLTNSMLTPQKRKLKDRTPDCVLSPASRQRRKEAQLFLARKDLTKAKRKLTTLNKKIEQLSASEPPGVSQLITEQNAAFLRPIADAYAKVSHWHLQVMFSQ